MLSTSALFLPKLGHAVMCTDQRVNLAERRFSLQEREFDMRWHSVWSAYFGEQSDEHDDFLKWFLESACPHPLKLAIEELPYGLLVCAKQCKDGSVPVLKHLANGTRVRKCRRTRTPPRHSTRDSR